MLESFIQLPALFPKVCSPSSIAPRVLLLPVADDRSMAYRLPSERRERAHESYAPSYLDDFLDQIEPLQASTKSKYAEMRALDDRINTVLTEADVAADEAVRRATTRGAIESVRRQYHEFIHLQASGKEFSDKKVALATQAEEAVDDVISDLDKRLIEFEAQLRKEGRWPGASPAANSRPPRSSRGQNEKVQPPTTPDLPPSSARNSQKSRTRREAIPANPATPRAAALAAARANAVAAATEKVDSEGDIVMGEMPEVELKLEPTLSQAEQAALDATPYCHCRRPSSGDMVACEAKGCKIEWYHFECVGLTKPPEGTWICDTCRAKKKKSGSRRR